MPIVFSLLPNKAVGSSFSPDEFNTLISTLTALVAAYPMANIPTPASLGLFPNKANGQKMTAAEFNNMVNLLSQLVTAANGSGTVTPTPTAPAAVTQLDATGGNGQVMVSLEAPASNGAAIQSYRYEYRAGTSGTWLVAGTTANTTYTITGLTNGTSYQFRAFATNSAGTSAAGAVVTATPTAGAVAGYQDIYIGDSLTTGYPQSNVLDANSSPTKTHALLDSTTWKMGTALGQGYPGQTATQIQAQGFSYVSGLKLSTVAKTFVVIRAGINNLAVALDSVDTTFSQLVALGTAFFNAGITPIFCTTTIARGGDATGYPGITYAQLDSLQADLNNRIKTQQATLKAVGVVDLGSDYRLNTNTSTYQQDGIHETAAGRDVVAALVAQGLQAAATGQTGFIITGQANGGTTTPATPTAPVTNDTADTFGWTNSAGYTSASQYEYTLNGGTSYATCTANPQPVGNISAAAGQVGVRVKAGSGNNASATLYNILAFTVSGPAYNEYFALTDLRYEQEALTYDQVPADRKGVGGGSTFIAVATTAAPTAVARTFNRIIVDYAIFDSVAKDVQVYLDNTPIAGATFSSKGSGTLVRDQQVILTVPQGTYTAVELRGDGQAGGNFFYLQGMRLQQV